MKIGVVSFDLRNRDNNYPFLKEIVDSGREFDLILFPGYTLRGNELVNHMLEINTNRNSVFVFEVSNENDVKWYIIKHKKILKGNSLRQLFSRGIEATMVKVENLLDELEENRRFNIRNQIARLLICGEIYMLVRNKSEINFRYSELNPRFREICDNTYIFLNPAHIPMKGWLNNVTMRCAFLSRNNRLCIYTNNKEHYQHFNSKGLQYVYFNGLRLESIDTEINENYRLSRYEI